MKVGGVYQIINLVNRKRYIGSAVSFKKRWGQHLSALRRGQHWNRHLQHAFDKYGEEAFAFSIREQIEDSSQLILREQHFLDTLLPDYNISPTAGSPLGFRHSLEARRKISEARMGKRHSPETRRKLSRQRWGGLSARRLGRKSERQL